MATGVTVVVVILIVVGVFWWYLGGKRRTQRRMQYNAEKRQERIAKEDQEWREKQERKDQTRG